MSFFFLFVPSFVFSLFVFFLPFVNPRPFLSPSFCFLSHFVFHLSRRESQKKRRESLVQRRKRKARLSFSFLALSRFFWFYPRFVIHVSLRALELWFVATRRHSSLTLEISLRLFFYRAKRSTRDAEGQQKALNRIPRLLLSFSIFFAFLSFFLFFSPFFYRRFKGQEEGRMANVRLYAFFTRNQEPRPCPGVGLTGDAHGYSYEIVCPVVSYRVVSLRVCKRCL